MSNLVVQPQDWDERGKGAKADRIDALALCQRLDRYVRGNRKAFSVVLERLKIYIKLIEPVEAEERKLTEQVREAARDQKIPKGVGALSFEVLCREVGDWSRFNNRREVSSDTGLCPRDHSSGGKRRGDSVNKSGN